MYSIHQIRGRAVEFPYLQLGYAVRIAISLLSLLSAKYTKDDFHSLEELS
jgi:hypothetical protein